MWLVLWLVLCLPRLEDVGLEKFSLPVLFTRIFIPAAFLLVLTQTHFYQTQSHPIITTDVTVVVFVLQVCIVHLHYFHEPFLQLTDLKTVVDTHNSIITRYHTYTESVQSKQMSRPLQRVPCPLLQVQRPLQLVHWPSHLFVRALCPPVSRPLSLSAGWFTLMAAWSTCQWAELLSSSWRKRREKERGRERER